MLDSLERYKALQARLDRALPDMLVKIGKSDYRTKKYWNAVVLALGITVELVSEERIEYEYDAEVVDDATGEVRTYQRRKVIAVQVMYKATLGNRESVGDGACSMDERRGMTYHDVRGKAHTRARNRCVSNLVAFGEVSAEEAPHDGAPY